MSVPEAPLRDTEHGRRPDGEGWFVLNLSDATALHNARGGTWTTLEPPDARFPEYGINVHVVAPGQPNALYHAESTQEDFLVLAGECLLIVEEQEHRLRAWDFVHCPAGTRHVFVGAGDGPCAILMVGARRDDDTVHYPASELAARYGASVPERTDSPSEAYPAAGFPASEPARFGWPPG